jgi:hypothetical protein
MAKVVNCARLLAVDAQQLAVVFSLLVSARLFIPKNALKDLIIVVVVVTERVASTVKPFLTSRTINRFCSGLTRQAITDLQSLESVKN